MRKLILLGLLVATALPGVANAQSMGEVRHDRREVRDDRRDLRNDRREVRDDRRDVRDDRRDQRHDRRDWHRDRRSGYVAPYGGWRYRPVTVGYQLQPAFWGQRYVYNDYSRWNLSAPRTNQRWVRYGNDLLLINARNGRVLQVIRNRF